MKREFIGIMRFVRVGYNSDQGECGLSCSVYLTEGTACQQFINWAQLEEMLKACKADNVKQLEGKPVWMYTDDEMPEGHSPGPGMIFKYDRPWKLP